MSAIPIPAIAHYNLLDRMGAGGIGDVFRARDTKVGRTVALKIVGPEIESDPERLEAFLEDARAAAKVSHPNVATLFDVGQADGHHYLAYEFASGRTVRDELAGGALPPRRALDLAIQIADAVSDAHAIGVLHGDLRPETVIVTGKGSAKVLDFGMAKWTRGGRLRARAALSPAGISHDASPVMAYLSPEQARGESVDGRTDVFSLGTLAYEMITGASPFARGTIHDTIGAVLQSPFVPPSQKNPAVPQELDVVLARSLTRDLEARQQSVAALAAELRTIAAVLDVRTGDAVAPSAVLPLDDSPDRNAAGLLALGLLGVAALAALAWFLLR